MSDGRGVVAEEISKLAVGDCEGMLKGGKAHHCVEKGFMLQSQADEGTVKEVTCVMSEGVGVVCDVLLKVIQIETKVGGQVRPVQRSSRPGDQGARAVFRVLSRGT